MGEGKGDEERKGQRVDEAMRRETIAKQKGQGGLEMRGRKDVRQGKRDDEKMRCQEEGERRRGDEAKARKGGGEKKRGDHVNKRAKRGEKKCKQEKKN